MIFIKEISYRFGRVISAPSVARQPLSDKNVQKRALTRNSPRYHTRRHDTSIFLLDVQGELRSRI